MDKFESMKGLQYQMKLLNLLEFCGIYTHIQWKRTTIQMHTVVVYQKLCQIVLFIFII